MEQPRVEEEKQQQRVKINVEQQEAPEQDAQEETEFLLEMRK